VIDLIERMTCENPTWIRRRIAAELAKLGHGVSKDTVAKYMPKRFGAPGRPSCGRMSLARSPSTFSRCRP
jgi:hypothetical protein